MQVKDIFLELMKPAEEYLVKYFLRKVLENLLRILENAKVQKYLLFGLFRTYVVKLYSLMSSRLFV